MHISAKKSDFMNITITKEEALKRLMVTKKAKKSN